MALIYRKLAGTTSEEFSVGLGVKKVDFKTNSGILQYRNYGGAWTNLGSGSSIGTVVFRVPVMADDSVLHFTLEVHSTANYSGSAVETVNSVAAQTNLLISDGNEWLAFPSAGVGTPYYDNKLAVALQSVVAGTQYYIRYKWFIKDSDPDDTPWYLSQYPALEINNLPDEPPVTPVASSRYVKGNITGAVAIDYTRGDFQVCTTTGTVTDITISDLPSEMGMVLRINNLGAYAVTYSGAAVLATTDTGDYACSFYNDNGTVYFMGKGRMY